MKIQKFAQSTFVVESSAGKRLLIDPGIYNFDGAFNAADFDKVDLLVITHKHSDHFDLDATEKIVRLHNPTILTNPEIAIVLQNRGVGSQIGQPGSEFSAHSFGLTCVKTDHVVRDEAIVNFGLLIEADGQRIYHTSDTRLIEVQLLPQEKVCNPDLLCVPIGNRGVVMGIDDALYFANEIKPRMIIPMHYDSPKDKERINPNHFVDRLSALSNSLKNLSATTVRILSFGEGIEIN
jgi:L-ascorbate metabolism protein UlaG (beta-lactamase superfamily)